MERSNASNDQEIKRYKKTTTAVKKMHALKEIVILTAICWIGFISRFYGEKHHDYGVLKSIFPYDKEWFKKFKVRLDLGFLGFVKDYVCRKVFIPIKKPKGKELTDKQREINTKQASERITVEHSIGGLKRYRILEDRLRLNNFNLYNDFLEMCAGLWNFSLNL